MNEQRQKESIKSLALIFVLGLAVLLTSCANKPQENKEFSFIITNAKSVGEALGCIFGCDQPSDKK